MLKDELKSALDNALFSAKAFITEQYSEGTAKLKLKMQEIGELYNSSDINRIKDFLSNEVDKMKLNAEDKAKLLKNIASSEIDELKADLKLFANGYYKLVKGLANINDKDPLYDIKDILRDVSGKV